jgi:phospholipid/cholesterol/gamma-HCH transport system substrate-binding protein
VPLRNAAVGPIQRNGAERDGALPASVKALRESTPELAFGRPYAVDLTGWFDDFGHSGVYDAVGGASRAAPHASAFALVNGKLTPILDPNIRNQVLGQTAKLGERNRCPGGADYGTAWKPYKDYNCDEAQVLPSAPPAKVGP